MAGFVNRTLLIATVVLGLFGKRVAFAAEPPADCTLLSADDVKKAVGKRYDAPLLMGDPHTFISANGDTDCNYTPRNVGEPLMLRVFVDSSPEQATEIFAKLETFHGSTTAVPGIGDEAYLDAKHAIHVRKGKVRYFIDLSEDAKADKPVEDLAAVVAGKL
jgi:hypothetical protein